MDDKKYVKNTCSKCLNKDNDKDLCNIVKTIDGKFKCCNEDLGQPGEFIRTEKGYMFLIDKNKDLLKLAFFLDASIGKIKKHSLEIRDIVEEMDIIEYKLGNFNNTYFGIVKKHEDPRSGEKTLLINGYKLKQINILKILTHERFNESCLEV